MTVPETARSSDKELSQLSARIDDLVQRIDFIADPAVRANVIALVQALTDLHGQGLARITQLLSQEGETGQRLLRNLADDEIVGGLLLLYECHPDTIELRLENAMNNVHEHFRSAGVSVTLVSSNDGVIRLRLTGGANGCGGADAIQKTVENFIFSAAPEISKVQVERGDATNAPHGGLVQLQLSAETAMRELGAK